jgi:hypothetical protein
LNEINGCIGWPIKHQTIKASPTVQAEDPRGGFKNCGDPSSEMLGVFHAILGLAGGLSLNA